VTGVQTCAFRLALLDVRAAQKTLDRQLGLDDFRPLAATGTLTAQAPPESPKVDETLLSMRPDVAVQEAVVKGFAASLSQARSTLWPNLSFNYSRSRTGPSEFPSAQYGWSFSGLLSYPLFSGGPTAAYYGVTAAKANLEKARQDLRATRDSAITDLETSWTDFARASAQARVQADLLAAARQRNVEADVRYDSGLMSYDNWEIISTDRINQERQTLSSRLNSVLAEAAWEQALGKQLGE
jgi:outer membrane protein TolC